MNQMMDMLGSVQQMTERFSAMDSASSAVRMVYLVVIVFGILNCLLGYRLLRFWVMLVGFGTGAGGGWLLAEKMGMESRTTTLLMMVGIGIVLGIVAFLIYKYGIFLVAAGIVFAACLYLIHPTTSFLFFVCVLAGTAAGVMGVRYAKEMIILGTSLLGGVISGISLCGLLGFEGFPYGILFCGAFTMAGLLIQVLTNQVKEEEREEETSIPDGKNEERMK